MDQWINGWGIGGIEKEIETEVQWVTRVTKALRRIIISKVPRTRYYSIISTDYGVRSTEYEHTTNKDGWTWLACTAVRATERQADRGDSHRKDYKSIKVPS